MAKWADYCISQVRYNSEHTHIVKVVACEDKGDTLGTSTEWTRLQVVSTLRMKKTFITIYKGEDGKYKKGEDVRIISINGVEYIRTDANNKAADNLGNLPEF
jgi:hypothetical protein